MRDISLDLSSVIYFFFFQAEDGIRDGHVTGVQTCALPISARARRPLLSVNSEQREIIAPQKTGGRPPGPETTSPAACASFPATSPGPEWRPAACDEPLRRESSSWLGNRAWLAGVRAFHHLFRGHSRARPHTPAARGAWDRFRDACAPRGWCQTSPRRLCLLQNGLGGRRGRARRGQCPSLVARAGWY